MNKKNIWLITVISGLILGFSVFSKVRANNIETVVEENSANSYRDVYFEIGNRIESSGKKFEDDVYLAGEEVRLDGIVNGDVIVASGDSVINGIIEQDLRVIGGNVTINAQVMGNVAILGGKVIIGDKAIFYKNLSMAAYESEINGQILGKAQVYSYLTKINLPIEDNWQVRTYSLGLGEKFRNEGSLTYYAPNKLPESSISAGLNYVENDLVFPIDKDSLANKFEYINYLVRLMAVVNWLFLLAAGYLLMKKYKGTVEKLTKISINKIKVYSKKGFKIWILLIVLDIGLFLTGIGMGPALILLSVLVSLNFLAKIIMSFIIGRMMLLRWGLKERRGLALLAGIVFNLAMSMIPILGWVYYLLIIITGVGIIFNLNKDQI